MLRPFSIPVLVLGLVAVFCFPGAYAQQQKQSTDPYAPPPPPPQPPSMQQPAKNCSGGVQWGAKGQAKSTSTCPPPPQNNDAPSLPAGQSAAPQAPKKSTADDNPFPEDVSRKAEDAARAADGSKPAAADAPTANESSSRGHLDPNLLGDNNSSISNGAGGVIFDPKRAVNDLHVGQFYMNREDYKGAYARFKEAVQVDPGNPDAVFYLAEAARKMNQNKEAAENYQLYLDAVPDGSKAKDARKALHDLNASAKH